MMNMLRDEFLAECMKELSCIYDKKGNEHKDETVLENEG